MKEKLRGQHERVKRNLPFSLVQHVEDCEALIKALDVETRAHEITTAKYIRALPHTSPAMEKHLFNQCLNCSRVDAIAEEQDIYSQTNNNYRNTEQT